MWNSLDQVTIDVSSINLFKGRLDKIRKNKDGFLWILHGLQSPRPHGDGTPVRERERTLFATITITIHHSTMACKTQLVAGCQKGLRTI